jgi:hypothetical protein
MRQAAHFAIPTLLRLRLAYPRVGLTTLPAQARPNLFGCD